jgi:hypothetical protein
MATMKRPRLDAVEALPRQRLKLTFVDGSIHTVSLAKDIERLPGEGWTVEWDALDIQIGADTLWLEAQAQNAPDENTRVFASWRAAHGLSLKQAAQALGMTPRTVSAYGTGSRPVPRHVALACKGWEAEHGQIA